MKNQLNREKVLPLIIFLSFLISVLITVIYVFLDTIQKNNLIVAITTFAATTTGLSAFSAYRSIHETLESQELNRKQEAEALVLDRTLSYIRRWNDLQFLPVRRVAHELYRLVQEQPPEKQENFLIQRLEDNRNEREDITNLLNFFEEMAICVEEKIVQEELLLKFFKGIVKDYCRTFSCYIQYRRKKRNNERIYRYLTNLYEKWEA
jgi:uncharacterized protein YktA (UPF0223 family)